MHTKLPKGLSFNHTTTKETSHAVESILTEPALQFLVNLHRRFEPRRQELLEQRQITQKSLDAGHKLEFLEETAEIRSDKSWKVGPIPDDLKRRWVEITGPTDRKMMINALNSGANVFMVDFEDANAPTWHNMVVGQYNLSKAIAGTLTFTSPEGKEYHLKEKIAVMMVRPRGWHLSEKNLLIDGVPISASLFDFGMAFFHNAKALITKGSGPYYYLPKMEHYLEARLWNDVFVFAQESLEVPVGTIRATVLIETIPAALQMEEIVYELREHSAGLNAGRWDYIFSILKKLNRQNLPLMPDRGLITMTRPFMQAYNILLIRTCHSRGASAIGGMAAYIPSRKDEAVNAIAMKNVREDKERESSLGFDGTWVAHPDLVPLAHEVFEKALHGKPNQLSKGINVSPVTSSELLNFHIPDGTITINGLRQNISVVLQYLTSWLQGTGAVAINNLMEDAATAEISSAQLWQWLHFPGAKLADGRTITPELYQAIADEEMALIASKNATKSTAVLPSDSLHKARKVMDTIVGRKDRTDFLTLVAYEFLK